MFGKEAAWKGGLLKGVAKNEGAVFMSGAETRETGREFGQVKHFPHR